MKQMLETTPPTSPVETPVVDPTVVPQPEPATPSPEPAPQPVNPEDTAEFWKNRYSESTREAQLLIEQNKLKEQQINQLTKPHDPTESELRAAYPEWEQMLPTEQRLARENFSLKQSHASIQQTTAELTAEVRWSKDLKTLKKKTDFAALAGKEDDFEEYVFKPNHKGIPLETLARSFLFGVTTPAAAPAPAAPPTAERSSGGPKPDGKPKKLSIEDARTLRQTNYQEYKRQLDAGNIDDEI